MSSHGERSPEAELGLLDATMIGMGAMIGAGIFVLTGLAADIAGPGAGTPSSGRCSPTSSRS